MSQRKGNAYDQGVPGDPRLLDSINRRTPKAAGMAVTHTHSATLIARKKTKNPKPPAAVAVPLHILKQKPTYIAQPLTPPAEGVTRLWVEWGSINNAVATNWDSHFDLTSDAVIYAEITLNTTSTYEIISSWEIATGTSVPAQLPWPESSPGGAIRPTKLYILLASYIHESSSISNTGGGSLIVGEYVTGMYDDYTTLGAVLTKALTWSRMNY